jgi:hypothetical protein
MILKVTFFPLPISNLDAIRHIKKYKLILKKMLERAFKLIIFFGIL